MTDYSKAEKELIFTLSPHWFGILHKINITPSNLYRILAIEAFIENKSGSEVEALRRVVTAIEKCTTYRLTPEFDKLCHFEKEKEK